VSYSSSCSAARVNSSGWALGLRLQSHRVSFKDIPHRCEAHKERACGY
jgi:hypothetical protein